MMNPVYKILSFLVVLTFLFYHPVPVYANATASGMIDIENTWYTEAVVFMVENEIISGKTDTTFEPGTAMTRGEMAAALWCIDGRNIPLRDVAFTDVPNNGPNADAIHWAADANIINGYGGGIFGIDDPVTREQAAILFRYEQYINETPDIGGEITFNDSSTIADWALEAVSWAAHNEIISGRTGNLFSPKEDVTRAEAAVMLYRYLQQGADNESFHPLQKAPEIIFEPTSSEIEAVIIDEEVDENGMMNVYISVGDQVFAAIFYDNSASQDFIEKMPITLNMADLNGNEKYYNFPENLHSISTERPAVMQAGKIMCWSGNCLVLFYKTFANSYGGYVPMGYIEDINGLTEALGSSSVEITFSLTDMNN